MLDLRPLQLHEDDGLCWAKKIVEHADDFEVKFFHLIPGKDGVSVALHSRTNLAEGKDFRGFLSADGTGRERQGSQERNDS